MKVIPTIAEIKKILSRLEGQTLGLVPTMGFLHEGHLSLARKSKKENQKTVVSIFVNPTQFGPQEDLERYPRDLKRDMDLLKKEKVDILFLPEPEDIYLEGYSTFVEVEGLDSLLCGKFRPGHFRGVATVVLKLFNIVSPNRTYFGQKDAQQAIIIKRMIKDLNLDIDIRVMPIVRESDGLAMSSRNVYLSAQEREAAGYLPSGLRSAQEAIEKGETASSRLISLISAELRRSTLIQVEYIEIVALDDLRPLEFIDRQNTLVAVAIRIGRTRLIDNFILGEI